MIDPIKKYAIFDNENRPVAFYSSDVHEEIPDGAVEITHEQWIEFIDNNGTRAFVNGEVVEVAPPAPPAPTWESVRKLRNQKLRESDWTQLADSPLSDSKRSEWVVYRQALRDLTEASSPDAVVWPDQPE